MIKKLTRAEISRMHKKAYVDNKNNKTKVILKDYNNGDTEYKYQIIVNETIASEAMNRISKQTFKLNDVEYYKEDKFERLIKMELKRLGEQLVDTYSNADVKRGDFIKYDEKTIDKADKITWKIHNTMETGLIT